MNPLRTLQAAWHEIPRVLPLMKNPAIPTAAKVLAVAAAALIISPLDVFGYIPILGQIDDVVLLGYVVHLFVKFCERTLAQSGIAQNGVEQNNVTPQGDGSIAIH